MSRTLAGAAAVLMIGCGGGGGGGDGPTGPPERVFSSLSVIPASATICTVVPGNAVTITATPGDQNGQPMSGLGLPSFTNSNPSTITVGAGGLVTALAKGTAQVTASLTANGTTRTAVATITVAGTTTGNVTGSVSDNHPLLHVAVITAAQLSVGGALTLNIQGQAFHSHTLTLTDAQVTQIAAGCRTSQVSSQDPHSDGNGPHTHTVSFN
jgi:hypothetical protein